MNLNECKDVFEIVKREPQEYIEKLFNSFENNVFSFKYSCDRVFSLFPFELESFGIKPGEETDERPDASRKYYKNYRDKNNRVILIEEYNAKGDVILKEFIEYGSSQIERFSFNKIGAFKIKSYSVLKIKDGRPVKLFNIGVKGESLWDFHYKNECLEKIDVFNSKEGKEVKKARSIEFFFQKDILKEVVYDYLNGERQSIFK